MEQDNCSLSVLVCKVRSLGRWRLAVQQARFQGQLSRAEKVNTGELREGGPGPGVGGGGVGAVEWQASLLGYSCCSGVGSQTTILKI